ncbi:hypothetical protein, partial [Hyphomonas sp.]|uniref:hypothetical protein n=1 Tax=Hyphomonas sp. TaxID=87 RepID=UPI0032972323
MQDILDRYPIGRQIQVSFERQAQILLQYQAMVATCSNGGLTPAARRSLELVGGSAPDKLVTPQTLDCACS